MDVQTDIHLTQGDTSQTTLAESFTMDLENEPGNTALNEDLVPDNFSSPSSNVHPSLVTGGLIMDPVQISGNIEPHEGENAIHPFKSNQDPSDIQTERNRLDYEHSCTHPQGNPDQVILTVTPKEVPPSGRAVVPAGELTSLIDINDSEAPTIVYPQESPLLRARTVSSVTPPRDEREADPDDRFNSIQMLHIEPDLVQSVGLARLTDEEETREDFDYPCEDFLPSQPTSSSPPQMFSSSPYASSQSSVGDVEPSKMVLAVEVEGRASSDDYAHGDHVALVAQDDSRLESEDLHSHDTAEVATLPETATFGFQLGPTSCIEGGLELSGKRIADPDELYGPQLIKRPKLDSRRYLPPAPRRATLASQHHQFQKLAAPFRPPLKLPVAMDGLAQTVDNRKVEPTISATLETGHDKIDLKGCTTIPLQHKPSNPSRPVTQFKSPLVNRVLPADSRTIRLTPALQELERKLQLLKRAIKVKEDSEEEVLTRLTGKWIEAGREIAYDVWDATKDAGDFQAKATSIYRSRGWESTDNRDTPWGWDTKPGDAGEASCDPDPSEAPYTDAGRLAAEEDDDAGCNTLGSMLRQLGIAPEIFGWDDDKETFSD